MQAEVSVVEEVQPTVIVDMSQRAELMEAINKLTSDINDVKVQNEELVAQLKANENPQPTLDQQANKNFKSLYQALMKSRRMLSLMHELLATSSTSSALIMPLRESRESLIEEADGMTGKRKRTE